jgi:hemerythrin-like domain-containing protein
MTAILEANIKEIIQEHPAVADVLASFDIACVSCNVGTCRLRDIIEIHNLDPVQEQVVMGRLAGIIFPDRTVELPPIRRKQQPTGRQLSPPLKKLVQEHIKIKSLLGFIPPLAAELIRNPTEARPRVESALDFIRLYADRFHHAKEEEVLFKYFDENAEILRVMRLDHEQARGLVRSIREDLDAGNHESVVRDLEAYRQLLEGHIQKEDEVLYPWMDRNLSTSQVGELYGKFAAIDAEFGDEPTRHERFVQRLEQSFGRK